MTQAIFFQFRNKIYGRVYGKGTKKNQTGRHRALFETKASTSRLERAKRLLYQLIAAPAWRTLSTASMACARASSWACVRWLIRTGMMSARSRKERRCRSEIHLAASLCSAFRSLKGVDAYTYAPMDIGCSTPIPQRLGNARRGRPGNNFAVAVTKYTIPVPPGNAAMLVKRNHDRSYRGTCPAHTVRHARTSMPLLMLSKAPLAFRKTFLISTAACMSTSPDRSA